jgi:hypothetical protein
MSLTTLHEPRPRSLQGVFLIFACLLAFLIALALSFPEPPPREHGYTVKQFCAEHPDICSHSRLAKFGTPSPIPQIAINP